MATILEALENAECNLATAQDKIRPVMETMLMLALSQLHNARILLDKGYSVYDDVDDLLTHGDVEGVPDKED